jgi:hypothetical protein
VSPLKPRPLKLEPFHCLRTHARAEREGGRVGWGGGGGGEDLSSIISKTGNIAIG